MRSPNPEVATFAIANPPHAPYGRAAEEALASLADRRPGQPSGGQQQRVALARALAGEHDLPLLDEPFSSLDAAVRERLGEVVQGLVQEAAITALFVTHVRGELRALAERVIVARRGQINEVVTPEVALCRSFAEGDPWRSPPRRGR